jgi:hypothetical protein
MKCVDSEVKTRVGVEYTQTECALSDAESIVTIKKYAFDINTGTLTMTGWQAQAERRRAFEKNVKEDI